MNLEQFEQLNADQKEYLMLHWWHYYGKMPYTLEELNKFLELLKSQFDKILELAVILYMYSQGPTILCVAIRDNKVDEILIKLPLLTTLTEKEKNAYLSAKECFISEIVKTSGIEFEQELFR